MDRPAPLQGGEKGRKPANVVLLGPPAGGKGTQAELLVERYGMVHISTGDLLRARAKFLPELERYMDSGRLVPDDIVSSVLKERLADRDCATRGVLLDGFPRTRAQAESLRKVGVDVTAVVHLHVADDVVVDRIAGRRIDPLSGKIYHVRDNPPPPEVAGRVIQREDDTAEKIRRRLATYHAERDSILNFYGDRVNTIRVGGTTQPALPDDVMPMLVFDRVRKALEGDTYRGAVIRSELIAKAFECGTYSKTLMTVAEFFEHSRFRLVHNGCLADAAAKTSRVVLRAQVLQLGGRLQPLEKYDLRAWLERVGWHSIIVGHAISQRLANGDVIDVARGSAALVFLDSHGLVMEVPGAKRLRELAAPATALRGHAPVNDVRAAFPDTMAEIIGPVPPSCWHTSFCVSAVDIDIDGRVHEASCIRYFEQVRFSAAMEGAYKEPSGTGELVLRAYTVRAYVAYVGLAMQGDIIKAFTWAFDPSETSTRTALDTIHLAFEVQATNGSLLLRGCLVVVPSSRPVSMSLPGTIDDSHGASGTNPIIDGPRGARL